MKKIIALLMTAVMLTAIFASCSASSSSLDAIQQKGEIVMYTNAAFPPFEYVTDGNTVAGVDVDIAQAIADEIGVELVVQNVEFDSIPVAIANGQADIGVAGMTVTEERKETVDFSTPYTTSVQYIIVPEDSDVETIEDLAGLTIGVQRGTTGDFIVSDEVNGYEDGDGNPVTGVLQDTGAAVETFRSAPEAALNLTSDKIGAVVIDALPAQNIVATNEGLKAFELVYADGSNTTEEYAIAINKDNDDLEEVINKVIEELKADGKIDEFIVHHSNQTALEE